MEIKPDNEILVDGDFPGGNIIVESVKDGVVELRQDLRDTATDWFYWCFRAKTAKKNQWTFRFTGGNVIGVRGPAVSVDNGRNWSWLEAGNAAENSFIYNFPENAGEVLFSVGMPYQEKHLHDFIKRHHHNPLLKVETLCRTKKDRKVECLRIRRPGSHISARVLIACRHHCCEMMGNYVLEGIMESVLSDPEQKRPLKNVEFIIIPFVDKDGVEDGDQGKNRYPHDHARDYNRESIYPVVRALREMISGLLETGNGIALDFHCPCLSGNGTQHVYIVGSKSKRIQREEQVFSGLLEKIEPNVFAFKASDYLPFGRGWNTADNFRQGKTFCDWVSGIPWIQMASTMEIPYADASGMEVNQNSARCFGRNLAKAISYYFQKENNAAETI